MRSRLVAPRTQPVRPAARTAPIMNATLIEAATTLLVEELAKPDESGVHLRAGAAAYLNACFTHCLFVPPDDAGAD